MIVPDSMWLACQKKALGLFLQAGWVTVGTQVYSYPRMFRDTSYGFIGSDLKHPVEPVQGQVYVVWLRGARPGPEKQSVLGEAAYVFMGHKLAYIVHDPNRHFADEILQLPLQRGILAAHDVTPYGRHLEVC